MAVGPQVSVLAPRFSRTISALIVAICVLSEVSLIGYGHTDALLRASPALAFAAFGSYTLFWAPLVRIGTTAIEVVNPLRTHRIAWPAIRDVTTQWTLTLVTDRGSFPAWAVSAQSPWSSVGRLHRDALGRPSLGAEQTSRAVRSTAGLAPIIVRQWETYRDEPTGETSQISTRWHRSTIIVLAALAALTLLGLLWP
jgi:hypothetical protein